MRSLCLFLIGDFLLDCFLNFGEGWIFGEWFFLFNNGFVLNKEVLLFFFWMRLLWINGLGKGV